MKTGSEFGLQFLSPILLVSVAVLSFGMLLFRLQGPYCKGFCHLIKESEKKRTRLKNGHSKTYYDIQTLQSGFPHFTQKDKLMLSPSLYISVSAIL